MNFPASIVRRIPAGGLLLAAGLGAVGCALRPAGEPEERSRIAEAGRPFVEPVEVPSLPAQPGPNDYLRHAFLANAELQARYWEWRAAIERVPQESSWPSVALPFSVLFNSENMKLWDRTTLGLQNDPMTNIPFPTKLAAAGRRALEAARAAGRRFEAAKFDLQARVLATYHDLALLAESKRIQEENVALWRLIMAQAAVRVRSGSAGQQDLLKAQTELDLAENELANLQAQIAPTAARLNALIGRPTDAPVPLPASMPAPRPLEASDAEIIRLAAERSPELAALARDVAGREEALDLARQGYLPDLALSFMFTGSLSQSVGGMIVLPTRLEAIQAAIEAAKADLQAAAALRTQYQRDLVASFVLNLSVLRNNDRQIALFERRLIPRAQEIIKVAQTAYQAGRADFGELLDAQRLLLEMRLTAARLRTQRERALIAIETWSAVDAEALRPVAGQ